MVDEQDRAAKAYRLGRIETQQLTLIDLGGLRRAEQLGADRLRRTGTGTALQGTTDQLYAVPNFTKSMREGEEEKMGFRILVPWICRPHIGTTQGSGALPPVYGSVSA